MSTKSSKNELQEYCTEKGWGYPVYELIHSTPEFGMRVRVRQEDNKELTAEGLGPRKKCAEKEAARIMLLKLQGVTPEDIQRTISDMENSGGERGSVSPMDDTKGATPLIPQSVATAPYTGKNYRSKLYEYCQSHGIKPIFSPIDNIDSQDSPRFSTLLTVEEKKVHGGGGSKKEAMEEAAKQMWELLEEEMSLPAPTPAPPTYTTVQTDPFTIGILPSDPTPPVPGLSALQDEPQFTEFDPNVPIHPQVGKFQPVSQAPKQKPPIPTDYVEQIETMLKERHAYMRISFVLIPTDGLITDHIFIFINLGIPNTMPCYTGHGRGATEHEAKNAAAYNLIQLLPDELKPRCRVE